MGRLALLQATAKFGSGQDHCSGGCRRSPSNGPGGSQWIPAPRNLNNLLRQLDAEYGIFEIKKDELGDNAARDRQFTVARIASDSWRTQLRQCVDIRKGQVRRQHSRVANPTLQGVLVIIKITVVDTPAPDDDETVSTNRPATAIVPLTSDGFPDVDQLRDGLESSESDVELVQFRCMLPCCNPGGAPTLQLASCGDDGAPVIGGATAYLNTGTALVPHPTTSTVGATQEKKKRRAGHCVTAAPDRAIDVSKANGSVVHDDSMGEHDSPIPSASKSGQRKNVLGRLAKKAAGKAANKGGCKQTKNKHDSIAPVTPAAAKKAGRAQDGATIGGRVQGDPIRRTRIICKTSFEAAEQKGVENTRIKEKGIKNTVEKVKTVKKAVVRKPYCDEVRGPFHVHERKTPPRKAGCYILDGGHEYVVGISAIKAPSYKTIISELFDKLSDGRITTKLESQAFVDLHVEGIDVE